MTNCNKFVFTILNVIASIHCVESITYQLNYEGIVSPHHVLKHAENPRNINPNDINLKILPPTIAEEAIVTIGTNLFDLWIKKKKSEKNNAFSGKQLPMDFNCFPGGLKKYHPQSTICVMDYVGDDLSFKIDLEIAQADGSWEDYFDDSDDIVEATTEDCIEETDKEDSCINKRIPVSMRVDSIIKTPDMDARMLLVESVPVINSSIQALLNPFPVWTIMERPSPLRMTKTFQKDYTIASNMHKDTVFDEEFKRQEKKQSIESVILSNHALVGRLPLYSTSLPSIQNKILADKNDSTGLHVPVSESINTDIWQYHEAGMDHSTRAIFLDSTLRAISNVAGVAHAEAFVHPAMISHGEAARVAVISDLPIQYVKQLLNYETVEHIELIGADWNAIEVSRKHVPSIDDCSHLEISPNSCMDSPFVKVVRNKSPEEWLDSKLHTNEIFEDHSQNKGESQYDVIFVDVTVSDSEKMLSPDFHKKLQNLMTSESILVVNAGSTPSMDRNHESVASEYAERDYFLEKLTSSTEVEDGIGYEAAFVYDEETSFPLDSTFILSFIEYGSESYHRFSRDSVPIIDLDLINQLYVSTSLVVYDGATHRRYLRPSRAWENWFCGMKTWKETDVCEILRSWFDYSLHLAKTKVERNAVRGRTLTAASNIKKGSFINPDDLYHSLRIDSSQWYSLNKFIETYPDATMYQQFRDFYLAYGFETSHLGLTGWAVSLSNVNTFTNHGCNPDEINVSAFEGIYDQNGEQVLFSPVISRRPEVFAQLTIAIKDIQEGEEIMMDYSSFRAEESGDRNEFHSFLKNICATGEGLVDNVVNSS